MLATIRRGLSTGEIFFKLFSSRYFVVSGWKIYCSPSQGRMFSAWLIVTLTQTNNPFFSGFLQRPWWVFCPRSSWCQLRRWLMKARSSSTSMTSSEKLPSFSRRPFLHLSHSWHASSISRYGPSLIWPKLTRMFSKVDPFMSHIQFANASPIYCKMFSKCYVLYIHMISNDQ